MMLKHSKSNKIEESLSHSSIGIQLSLHFYVVAVIIKQPISSNSA